MNTDITITNNTNHNNNMMLMMDEEFEDSFSHDMMMGGDLSTSNKK